MTVSPDEQLDKRERPVRRVPDLVLVLVLAVVGAIITWFRVPPGHHDRVWAEDANIFLAEALQRGPLAVLFEGYAGYQHFVPRVVVAAIFPFFDMAAYPIIVFVITAVLTGLVGAGVYWLSGDVVRWRPARVSLALVTFLIPLATQETVGNLADIHTYAMWLTPWLLLYRPKSWGTSTGWALVAFATVATEIQAVFFVFLIFFRLKRTDRLAWPVFGGFILGAALQVATAVAMGRSTGNGPLSIPSTVAGWLINSVMPLVTANPDLIRRLVLHYGLAVSLVILIPLALASAVALWWGTGDHRLITVALLLGSAAIYTGSAWANSASYFMYAEEGLENIDVLAVNIRYGVASGMMLVAVVPVACDALLKSFPAVKALPSLAAAACAGMIIVIAVGSTMTISLRDWVPVWSEAVEQARIDCVEDSPDAPVILPVAPDRTVELRCSDVLAHR